MRIVKRVRLRELSFLTSDRNEFSQAENLKLIQIRENGRHGLHRSWEEIYADQSR